MALALGKYESHSVTLIGASCPNGVTFAFTERSGGVSEGAYASLNLGDACGDETSSVATNRARALAALGASGLEAALVNPKQVHGSHVVVLTKPEDLAAAQAEARKGADAVVCTVAQVPVLICVADCVPVVLVGQGGFAVVHSGWRGTIERIAGKAARMLANELGQNLSSIEAYLGPHVREADYEVSPELITCFREAFGDEVSADGIHLSLTRAVIQTLAQEGLTTIVDACPEISTPSATDRFFSYRASEGACGRIGALAIMGADDLSWEVR